MSSCLHCSLHGVCVGQTCRCDPQWMGESCSTAYSDVFGPQVTEAYGYGTAALFAVLVVLVSFVCVRILLQSRDFSKVKLPVLSLVLLDVASLLRVVSFALDPGQLYNTLPAQVESLLFNLPVVLWTFCFLCVLFYLFQISKAVHDTELVTTELSQSSKCCLGTVTSIFTITVFTTALLEDDPRTRSWARLSYNIILSITFFTIATGFKVYGSQLSAQLSQYPSTPRLKAVLRKIRNFLREALLIAVLLVATLICFAIFVNTNTPWLWLIFSITFRLVEVGLSLVLLITFSSSTSKNASKAATVRSPTVPRSYGKPGSYHRLQTGP
eukprot:PLAT7388.1.p1 GENE.PLAT7388.1~~PLAT7388.1.p1  ORF type:complete len:326 (-),score=60.80 PLAT7388.1:87-1064(-)